MKVKTGIIAGQSLGDSAEDLAELIGAKRLAEMYERITGKPCGCAERKEKLNDLSFRPLGFLLGT